MLATQSWSGPSGQPESHPERLRYASQARYVIPYAPCVVHDGLLRSPDKKRSGLPGYSAIIAVSLLAGAVAAEIFLAYRNAPRAPLPFYNRLYPYVMFRPN